MSTQIVSKQYLAQQVFAYAKLQAKDNYGWWLIHDNAQRNGVAEILEVLNDSEAYDVPTAISAMQEVATANNEDN